METLFLDGLRGDSTAFTVVAREWFAIGAFFLLMSSLVVCNSVTFYQ